MIELIVISSAMDNSTLACDETALKCLKQDICSN